MFQPDSRDSLLNSPAVNGSTRSASSGSSVRKTSLAERASSRARWDASRIDGELSRQLGERVPPGVGPDQVCEFHRVAEASADFYVVTTEKTQIERGVVCYRSSTGHEPLELPGDGGEFGSRVDLRLCDACEVLDELRKIATWIDECMKLVDGPIAVKPYGANLDYGITRG